MLRFHLFVSLLCVSSSLLSQNLEKSEISQLKLRGNGAIFREDAVKGYYFFYEAERKDKSSNNYILRVLDEDVKDVDNVTFSKPLNYRLVESSYNGSCFLFLFFDSKQKKINLVSFDSKLKKIGEIERDIQDKVRLRTFKDMAYGLAVAEKFLTPISKKGFIYYENGSIRAYTNSLDSLWMQKTAGVPSDGFYSDRLSGFFITRNVTELKTEYDLLVNDPQSGAFALTIQFQNKLFTIAPHHVSYDSVNQQILVFGEYFDKKDNPLYDASLGFCNMVYDAKGKYISSKTISREEILSKPLTNYNGNAEELQKYILFHEFVRTKDGEMFVIGEEFKRTTGVGRILMARYMPPAVLSVYNLVVYQFTAGGELAKIHVFHKNRTKAEIPSGGLFMSHKVISNYVKKYGGFDFRFMQEFPDKGSFAVVYKDVGKGEEILGTVVYTPEKVFQNDKIIFKRAAVQFAVLPAKPGYIFLAEFLKKEKKFDMRLEKINY